MASALRHAIGGCFLSRHFTADSCGRYMPMLPSVVERMSSRSSTAAREGSENTTCEAASVESRKVPQHRNIRAQELRGKQEDFRCEGFYCL